VYAVHCQSVISGRAHAGRGQLNREPDAPRGGHAGRRPRASTRQYAGLPSGSASCQWPVQPRGPTRTSSRRHDRRRRPGDRGAVDGSDWRSPSPAASCPPDVLCDTRGPAGRWSQATPTPIVLAYMDSTSESFWTGRTVRGSHTPRHARPGAASSASTRSSTRRAVGRDHARGRPVHGRPVPNIVAVATSRPHEPGVRRRARLRRTVRSSSSPSTFSWTASNLHTRDALLRHFSPRRRHAKPSRR